MEPVIASLCPTRQPHPAPPASTLALHPTPRKNRDIAATPLLLRFCRQPIWNQDFARPRFPQVQHSRYFARKISNLKFARAAVVPPWPERPAAPPPRRSAGL